jgi:hypothetical protein
LIEGRTSLGLAALAALAMGGCDRWPGNHDYGPPTDPRIVTRLCTSELGGPGAEVRVWRDGARAVALYDLVPDPDGPHKGVTSLYDSRGREQLKLPAPDMATSPEALERDRRRDAVLEDTKRTETIECGKDAGR